MASPKLDKCLESIHRMEVSVAQINVHIAQNTMDLANHIKRTNLLEGKLSRVYVAAYVGLGFMAAKFGPDILRLIGL